jgi:hypothetical protein
LNDLDLNFYAGHFANFMHINSFNNKLIWKQGVSNTSCFF